MDQAGFYVLSPFESNVEQSIRLTAYTILAVYVAILFAGLIGHFCVMAFLIRRLRTSSSAVSSAYVLLANISIAQIFFLAICLPSAAYQTIMNVVTAEWLFGDVTCKLSAFLEVVLLGVTVLGFCAMVVDRFTSADHISKTYQGTGDSRCRSVCKILALWLGALLLAGPELLLKETQPRTALLKDIALLRSRSSVPTAENSLSGMMIFSRSEYVALRNAQMENVLASKQQISPDVGADDDSNLGLHSLLAQKENNNTKSNVDALVRYDVCVTGMRSWSQAVPPIFLRFMECYAAIRHWWIFSFYLCLPLFVVILFVILLTRRLTSAVEEANSPLKYCPSNHSDAGTLTMRGADTELAPIVSPAAYPTDSLPSNRTYTSDSLYQHRMASIDRQASSPYMQFQSRLSPLLSSEDLTENDTSPVVCLSSGSIRTVGSCQHPVPELSPQLSPLSPVAPSIACMSGVSVLSLAMSNVAGGGTIGNTSLPPHGHGKSVRRRSTRLQKKTLKVVARERAIKSWLVALLVAFVLTQLPLRIIDILRNEWKGFDALDGRYVTLLDDLCRYCSVITFALTPVVSFLFYKNYREFLLSGCFSGKCC